MGRQQATSSTFNPTMFWDDKCVIVVHPVRFVIVVNTQSKHVTSECGLVRVESSSTHRNPPPAVSSQSLWDQHTITWNYSRVDQDFSWWKYVFKDCSNNSGQKRGLLSLFAVAPFCWDKFRKPYIMLWMGMSNKHNTCFMMPKKSKQKPSTKSQHVRRDVTETDSAFVTIL